MFEPFRRKYVHLQNSTQNDSIDPVKPYVLNFHIYFQDNLYSRKYLPHNLCPW